MHTVNVRNKKIEYKKLLFEYIVLKLAEWNQQIGNKNELNFTKLRLQKVLFFICAWNTDINNKGLLESFDNFAALPYGPVELDIYDSMCGYSPFSHIEFEGNYCKLKNLSDKIFCLLKLEDKERVDVAIESFKEKNFNYLSCPVFDLVDITHQWTVWQVAMKVAEMMGSKKEEMTTEDICNSTIKAF